MNKLTTIKINKKVVVIVGFYLPGIYPSGDYTVISDLLAPAFLKTAADADPEIYAQYEIKILNLPTTEDLDSVAHQINDLNPYIVGYSVYMWNYDQMVESASKLKRLSPDIQIMLGGPQVSYNPEEVLKLVPEVDIIVCGSGESRLKQILKSDLQPGSLSKIPKISFRGEDNTITSTQGEVFEDLSKIPSPFQTGVINLDDGRKHTVYIETSRGCPFECGYCIWGEPDKSLYKFPLQQILDDIEIVYNHPNVECVYITDACLYYTRERAKIITEKIASCSRKIPTVATLDILVVNEEMIKDCKKLELIRNQFHFGLQSTNPTALELLKRKSGPDIFEKRIGQLRKIIPDSEISFDIIYGLPGDCYQGFRESVNFALKLHPGKLYLSPLLLLPGTPFWDDKKQLGFDYEDKPPYMVRANKDYSAEDMRKTIPLVLWLQALNYFPVIMGTLCKIPNYNSNLKPIDLIDQWIKNISSRVDPVSNIDFDYTNESFYAIRRHVMNTLSEPENCLHVYESTLELLKSSGAESLLENILIGIDHYRSLLNSGEDNGDDNEAIKVKWVKAVTPVVHGEG